MLNTYRVSFSFAGITVSLVASKSSILWCLAYFKHYIYLTNDDDCDIEIELTDDYDDCISRAYDTRIVNDMMHLSYDEKFQRYLVHFFEGVNKNRSFMRLVRNLILNELECRGCIFLHAACVSFLGMGVGILGDRMAGKSTTCLSLLRDGFDFTTNDKLAVTAASHEIDVIGIPVSVGIRRGTRTLFPDICYEGEKSLETDKIYLTPQMLCEQFHASICNRTKLKLFILPVYDPCANTIVVSKLNDSERQSLIEKQILSSVYENYISYKKPGRSNQIVIDELKRQLLQIPVWQIRQNAHSLKDVPQYIKNIILNIK